jgi:hypothetical protein
MDKVTVDYKVILFSRFIHDNNLISQLGAEIFIIYEWFINKYKEFSGRKINKYIE